MLHQLQHLMGSPTVFSKLEITTVVIVALAAGMVLGGLAGTSRRLASVPHGYTPSLRGPVGGGRAQDARLSRMDAISNAASGVVSDVASAGWAGAGLTATPTGGGVWVTVAGAGTYQPGAQRPGVYQSAAYRSDAHEAVAIEQLDARPARKNRPLWRFGTALFSVARARAVRAVTPPAGTARAITARPGRHRASRARTGRPTRTAIGSTWARTS